MPFESLGHDNAIPQAPDHTESFIFITKHIPSIPITKAMRYSMGCSKLFGAPVLLQDWTPEMAGGGGRLDGIVLDLSRSPDVVFMFLASLPLSCLFDRFENVGEGSSIGFRKYRVAP